MHLNTVCQVPISFFMFFVHKYFFFLRSLTCVHKKRIGNFGGFLIILLLPIIQTKVSRLVIREKEDQYGLLSSRHDQPQSELFHYCRTKLSFTETGIRCSCVQNELSQTLGHDWLLKLECQYSMSFTCTKKFIKWIDRKKKPQKNLIQARTQTSLYIVIYRKLQASSPF